MSFFGRRDDDEYEGEGERITETTTYRNDDDRGDEYDRRERYERRDDEVIEERTTTYYADDDRRPAPPNVPYGWRSEWHPEQRRYIFVNERSGERQFDLPDRGYVSETTTTYYNNDERRGEGYERECYRENEREGFGEDVARWTGRKVQEVEDIPHDIEQGFDRFGNRIERPFRNAGNAFEEGKYEARNEDRYENRAEERYENRAEERYENRAEERFEDRGEERYEERTEERW